MKHFCAYKFVNLNYMSGCIYCFPHFGSSLKPILLLSSPLSVFRWIYKHPPVQIHVFQIAHVNTGDLCNDWKVCTCHVPLLVTEIITVNSSALVLYDSLHWSWAGTGTTTKIEISFLSYTCLFLRLCINITITEASSCPAGSAPFLFIVSQDQHSVHPTL